jgi:hypothetical protein
MKGLGCLNVLLLILQNFSCYIFLYNLTTDYFLVYKYFIWHVKWTGITDFALLKQRMDKFFQNWIAILYILSPWCHAWRMGGITWLYEYEQNICVAFFGYAQF